MGVVLIRSAHSSNIKERRDASTALFDADGQMIMQAEHIPCISARCPRRWRRCSRSDHAPGRLVDPQRSVRRRHPPTRHHRRHAGLRAGARRLLGFAASRAHHADVGARVPGSMPADSHTLQEEGVVISPRAARRGDDRGARHARCASREERRADLRAQLAANRAGARASRRARRRALGADRLREATDAVLDYCRAPHARLPGGAAGRRAARRGRARGAEGDLRAAPARRIDGERLLLDFAGSAPQHDGNLNCPLAVTRSACLFAVRVLTDPDIPPTAGAYRPIEVRAPRRHGAERAPRRSGRGRQRRDLLARGRPRARARSDAHRARAR